MPVGLAVTLRGDRMYEFLDRLMSVAIPRIRDFRGLKTKSFDGRGNYAMGVREQVIFPEIDYDAVDQVRGLDIIVTTSAETDEEAFALLKAFGMPFAKPVEKKAPAPVEPEPEAEAAQATEAEPAPEAADAPEPESAVEVEAETETEQEAAAPAAEADAPEAEVKPESEEEETSTESAESGD